MPYNKFNMRFTTERSSSSIIAQLIFLLVLTLSIISPSEATTSHGNIHMLLPSLEKTRPPTRPPISNPGTGTSSPKTKPPPIQVIKRDFAGRKEVAHRSPTILPPPTNSSSSK